MAISIYWFVSLNKEFWSYLSSRDCTTNNFNKWRFRCWNINSRSNLFKFKNNRITSWTTFEIFIRNKFRKGPIKTSAQWSITRAWSNCTKYRNWFLTPRIIRLFGITIHRIRRFSDFADFRIPWIFEFIDSRICWSPFAEVIDLMKSSILRICRFSEVVDLPNSSIYRICRFSEFVDFSNSSISWIRRFFEFVDIPNSSIFWIRRFSEFFDIPNSSIFQTRRYPEFVDFLISSIFRIRRFSEFVDLPNSSISRIRRFFN